MPNPSPFPTAARRKNASMRHIDPDMLQISDDAYTGVRATPEGKYSEIFAHMKPGQCIKCEPKEAGPLSQALRKWLYVNKRDGQFEVRSMARYHTDQRGRVWLLQKQSKLQKAA